MESCYDWKIDFLSLWDFQETTTIEKIQGPWNKNTAKITNACLIIWLGHLYGKFIKLPGMILVHLGIRCFQFAYGGDQKSTLL